MKQIITITVILFGALSLIGQAPEVRFQSVATGFSNPLDVVNAGDGTNRLFVVQRSGQIRIFSGGTVLAGNFLDISSSSLIVSGGEQGLLSVAFHPNYENNGYFFVWYTNPSGDLELARYSVSTTNPNLANSGSRKILLTVPHPTNSNHNGAKLLFGSDGYLYVGTGDGGSGNDPANNAQNGASLLGKMLRLDVDDFNDASAPFYNIPATNPYQTLGDGVADEILAIGLRNPWRWSFDRQTGDMWIGDVGQSSREEVDFRAAANLSTPGNYGWRCREGEILTPGVGCAPPANNVEPVFTYQRNSTTGGFSITGGHVYRGTLFPSLQGWYICVDYVSNNIFFVRNNAGVFENDLQNTDKPSNIAGFGESESGELYAVSLGNGGLFQVIVPGVLPLKLLQFTGRVAQQQHQLQWHVAQEEAGTSYLLEKSQNGSPFVVAATLAARATPGNQQYLANLNHNGAFTSYRLRILTAGGQQVLSPTVMLGTTVGGKNSVYAAGNQLQLQLKTAVRQVDVLNVQGQLLQRKALGGIVGNMQMPAPQKGLLLVRIWDDEGQQTHRVMVY
jgi:glucose/arabinose dehydrogenase